MTQSDQPQPEQLADAWEAAADAMAKYAETADQLLGEHMDFVEWALSMERACSRCYRPTTSPDLCDRCQPGGTT